MVEQAGIRRDDYIPAFWDLCTHRGFLWALPSTPTSLALHWNKKLFREAGLDPDRPPRSLDELEEMSVFPTYLKNTLILLDAKNVHRRNIDDGNQGVDQITQR